MYVKHDKEYRKRGHECAHTYVLYCHEVVLYCVEREGGRGNITNKG